MNCSASRRASIERRDSLLNPLFANIGDYQPGALCMQALRHAPADGAEPLDSQSHPVKAIGAEYPLQDRTQSLNDALGGRYRGIDASGGPSHKWRDLRDPIHVGDGDADIFSGRKGPPYTVNEAAVGMQQ